MSLTDAAHELAEASNELSREVDRINAEFKALCMGIEVWMPLVAAVSLGYAKLGREWGLCIRDGSEEGPGEIEKWKFSDAPRAYRILAAEALPRFPAFYEQETRKWIENVRGAIATVKAFKISKGV